MTKFSQLSDSSRGILFASVTALMWGFLAIALKVALKEVDPVTLAWFRFLLAFVLLLIFLGIRSPQSIKILTNPPLLAIIAAIGLAVNYVGYIKGVELTSPSNAQILIQIAPVLLAISGLVFFKEKMTRIQAFGFIMAITGFIVFYKDQLSNLLTSEKIYNTGILVVVGASFTWVVYAVLQKILVRKYNPQSLNLIIYGVPAIILIPFIELQHLFSLSVGMWLLLIYLGVNTFLAYGFLAEAFKLLEANKVGIIVTLNPMITIVTMLTLTYLEVSWIEPERISSLGIFGALLVISGAILAVRSKKIKPILKKDINFQENTESLTAKI